MCLLTGAQVGSDQMPHFMEHYIQSSLQCSLDKPNRTLIRLFSKIEKKDPKMHLLDHALLTKEIDHFLFDPLIAKSWPKRSVNSNSVPKMMNGLVVHMY